MFVERQGRTRQQCFHQFKIPTDKTTRLIGAKHMKRSTLSSKKKYYFREGSPHSLLYAFTTLKKKNNQPHGIYIRAVTRVLKLGLKR